MKIFNKIKGNLGEEIAAKFLKDKKYKIIKRNYKNKIGEIDIVAKRDSTIVFVEVKTRANEKYGSAAEAVDLKKQQKIKNTAMLFVQKNKVDNLRFDVVEVYLDSGEINHIINAF